MKKFLLVFFINIILFSCSTPDEDPIDPVIGVWESIIDLEEGLASSSLIIFNEDGTGSTLNTTSEVYLGYLFTDTESTEFYWRNSSSDFFSLEQTYSIEGESINLVFTPDLNTFFISDEEFTYEFYRR